MNYLELAKIYEKLESTSKRLEKTYYISKLLKRTTSEDIEHIILLLQGRLFPAWDQTELGVSERLVIKAINIATGISADDVEKEWKKTGDLGLVAENFVKKKRQATLFSKDLIASKVFNNLHKIPEFSGAGTVDMKVKLIAELLTSAKPLEARYIVRTVIGELRVGVGSGILRDAIVWSELPAVAGIMTRCHKCEEIMPSTPKCLECGHELKTKFKDAVKEFDEKNILKIDSVDDVKDKDLRKYKLIYAEDEGIAREAYNYLAERVQKGIDTSNDFSIVLKTLRDEGILALNELKIKPGVPIKVMLAQKVKDVKEGFETVGVPCQIEFKYDGFRLAGHKHNGKITLFTRRLENVTTQFPEVVKYIEKNVKGSSFIIDCEACGYDPKTKKYRPFQEVSQRIKRKYDIEKLAKELPVELNIFDVIFYDGKSMLNAPFKERRALIEKIVHEEPFRIRVSQSMETSSEKDAENFYRKSLDAGNEGIMLKSLDSPYKPGSRVGYMVKLKPVMETLDLVIVGADWGEGKRANWLTSFILACRDEDGELIEIGRVGTGFKEKEDEEGVKFEELTEMLKPLIKSEKGKEITVKPKIVLEIKYEEIQKSPTYSSGFALRFPRAVRLREDRGVDDISTIKEVKKLYDEQRGR